ncbi:hypothetical protein QBC39DRAFT_382871 [Podospora conica]|nr:hypothetical protein QBC39DRAFT_382871 [Schizothecium conicum]
MPPKKAPRVKKSAAVAVSSGSKAEAATPTEKRARSGNNSDGSSARPPKKPARATSQQLENDDEQDDEAAKPAESGDDQDLDANSDNEAQATKKTKGGPAKYFAGAEAIEDWLTGKTRGPAVAKVTHEELVEMLATPPSPHWTQADEEALLAERDEDPINEFLDKAKESVFKSDITLWKECLKRQVGQQARGDDGGRFPPGVSPVSLPWWSKSFNEHLARILLHDIWAEGHVQSLVMAIQFVVIARADDRRTWPLASNIGDGERPKTKITDGDVDVYDIDVETLKQPGRDLDATGTMGHPHAVTLDMYQEPERREDARKLDDERDQITRDRGILKEAQQALQDGQDSLAVDQTTLGGEKQALQKAQAALSTDQAVLAKQREALDVTKEELAAEKKKNNEAYAQQMQSLGRRTELSKSQDEIEKLRKEYRSTLPTPPHLYSVF